MTEAPQGPEMPGAQIAPVHVRLVSGQLAVREALSEVLDALAPLELDVEEAGTVELVLAEVLNNIVEHAYPPPDPSGPIEIHCTQQSDGLLVRIRDEGRAMPDGQLPLGDPASLDVELEDLPEGGFGWFLVRHLARDVTYSRVDGENHLRMRLAIGIQGADETSEQPTRLA